MSKTVLITGATSGIGLELARLFAADGYQLVIAARSSEELESASRLLSSTYEVNVIPVAIDLFRAGSATELYQTVKEKGVQIDVLVNNAGQGVYGLFADSDISRQLNIIQLNIASLVELTYLCLREMQGRSKGHILNLSSIAAKIPGPWQAVYHGTKAFVQSFTEALHSELKDQGIVVTALLPGATDTDFFNKAGMNASKIAQDKDDMSDPATVAKDGYAALMRGDDQVVSGLRNKLQVAISNITPDATAADRMKDMQEPASGEAE